MVTSAVNPYSDPTCHACTRPSECIARLWRASCPSRLLHEARRRRCERHRQSSAAFCRNRCLPSYWNCCPELLPPRPGRMDVHKYRYMYFLSLVIARGSTVKRNSTPGRVRRIAPSASSLTANVGNIGRFLSALDLGIFNRPKGQRLRRRMNRAESRLQQTGSVFAGREGHRSVFMKRAVATILTPDKPPPRSRPEPDLGGGGRHFRQPQSKSRASFERPRGGHLQPELGTGRFFLQPSDPSLQAGAGFYGCEGPNATE